jgi:hypothetical protein
VSALDEHRFRFTGQQIADAASQRALELRIDAERAGEQAIDLRQQIVEEVDKLIGEWTERDELTFDMHAPVSATERDTVRLQPGEVRIDIPRELWFELGRATQKERRLRRQASTLDAAARRYQTQAPNVFSLDKDDVELFGLA